MADIAIKKKNNVYLTVQSDPSIAQELVDHFSFDAPGAKFHPLFRNKIWDGKIRLFSMFTKELYVGLKTYLEHFAEVNNYTIDYKNITEKTGMDCAKWLVAESMTKKIPLPQIYVHSANPIGSANMMGYLNNYFMNSK